MRRFEAAAAQRAEVPQFYSVTEAAAMFGLSPMTIYRAIAAGEFPAIKIRGRFIVPARAIEAMIDAAAKNGSMVDAAGWVGQDVSF